MDESRGLRQDQQIATQATKRPLGRPEGVVGADGGVNCGSSFSPLSDDGSTLSGTDKMRQLWTQRATRVFAHMRQASKEP